MNPINASSTGCCIGFFGCAIEGEAFMTMRITTSRRTNSHMAVKAIDPTDHKHVAAPQLVE
jgi:hypothetical protein